MYIKIVGLFGFSGSSNKSEAINSTLRNLEGQDFVVKDVQVVSDSRGEIVSAVIKYVFGG